jgi:site-specific DNA-cytosine methylase
LGWKAAWLSEIEPFPSAVLAHHYPDVPNLGDMTTLPERILSGEVEAPDVFCGGTPCQAFSVAGLRNSLDDARGNLSLTFVGIANAIDHVRSVRSDAPAIIFWENVPGVLSTKDNAFGCFLGALAGEDDPIIPSGEKWTNAGCVYGPQRTVAWRVLDAQYFGVAQRRRRVFVVASARADFDPAAVLFEFDGVRRDTAPSRKAREESAGGIGDGASKRSWPAEVSSTLDTTFGTKQGLEDQHVNAGCPLFVPAQTFSIPAIGHIVQDDVASTMTRHTGSGAGETQNAAFVAQPMAYTTKMHNTTSNQAGKFYEEYSTSLDANSPPPAVFQPITYGIRTANTSSNGWGIQEEVTHTLDCAQGVAVAHVVGALACNTGPNGHDAGNFACNQAVDAGHVLPVAFQQTADCLTAVYGTKWNGNASATNGSLFAAQPLNIYGGNKRPDRPEGGFYVRMEEDTTKTLDAATGLNPTC